MNKINLFIFSAALFSSFASAAEPTQPSMQKLLSAENGRFVFGQISDARRDQYMLDTKTGRLWKIVAKTEGGYSVLEPVTYIDDNGKEVTTPKN